MYILTIVMYIGKRHGVSRAWKKPLTLILSQRERGKRRPDKINVPMHQGTLHWSWSNVTQLNDCAGGCNGFTISFLRW
jgi:hypothetical protein